MSAGSPSSESSEDVKELLLEEYRAATDSLWKNEQTGETRVNWFIGIVTAAVGGLVALASAENGPRGALLFAIIIGSLLALLVFGMITLLRIVRRNAVTDGLKQDIFSIRQVIKDHFDPGHLLLYYQPFIAQKGPNGADPEKWADPKRVAGKGPNAVDPEKCAHPKSRIGKKTGRKLGGLASMAAAINGLLAGAVLWTIAYLIPVTQTALFQTSGVADLNAAIFGVEAADAGRFLWSSAFAIAWGGLFFICQHVWIRTGDERVKKKLLEGRPTHAGGIVYQVEDGVVEWLVTGPKGSKGKPSPERFFPRGHIDPGEGHAEAALREVREETGVVARLVCLVDRVAFKDGDKNVDAKFYLMEWLYATEPAPRENRQFEFMPAKKAFQSFKSSKYAESTYLLQQAIQIRARLFASPKSQRTTTKHLSD